MFVLLTGNGRKVLFQTSVGRKRKLSTYRSKRDIYVKKHKVISQRNMGFNQNFVKISKSETNDDIDVVNTDSDYSEETESFDLSFDSDGPEEIQLNEGNNDMGNVPNDDVILDEDYDFRVSALKKLKDTDLLDKLTEILDESGQLFDFMSLLEHLTSKRIPCTNIVFVLLLERARFETCSNTVGMRYCKLTKRFWSIVYRLCKGIGLKKNSGQKHWGQVVSKKSRKSRYEGRSGKVNFAVPDEKILRNFNRTLPKVIPPGKIQSSLNLLANKEEFNYNGRRQIIG